MTSKEYKDNIRDFTTEFLDYYRLNNLDLAISSCDFREFSMYSLHIYKFNVDNVSCNILFNINEYKDRLVSFLQNVTTEYVCSADPELITVHSINRRGESVKTMYFDLKAFSNTRFEEPIERIELTIIRK
jgi:hypothetical protein